MIVSKQDLDNFGLLSALPEELKKMEVGNSFVFYYDVDEENVKLKIFEYETVKQITINLFRGVQDKQKKYQSQVNIGCFTFDSGETFDTKDGLFFQFLKTFNTDDAVFSFYDKIIEQDKITDLTISINALTDIVNQDGFRRAISYFNPLRMQPIMLIYDMVNQAFKNKLGVSLYGDTIQKVVNLIKVEGGVLPEWDKSTMRYMVIGPHAQLTKDQKDRLKAADALIRSGHTIESVYSQTGWALGDKDGKWRTNIADNEAKISFDHMTEVNKKRLYVPDGFSEQDVIPLTLNPNLLYSVKYPGRLIDVLKHPTLYEYYPWLATIPIVYWFQDQKIGATPEEVFANSKPQDFYFAPNERGGLILINGSFLAGDSLSILLHEIQHAIQNEEGYATGGNMFLAQFVSAVGADMVRKIFAAINKMQHLFAQHCLDSQSRTEIQSILKGMRINSRESLSLRGSILEYMSDQKTYEDNAKTINFYLCILLSEEGDLTSPLFEVLQQKIGDYIYEIFNVIKDGYDAAKKYEEHLQSEGYSKGYVLPDGTYKRGDIDTILFKGYENLYGEMESRSTQSSRFVQSQYKNYFYLTHWELGPIRTLTVIDGVEEVVDCQKIVGACESIGDLYILHFEKNDSCVPFIHELGHIVYDALKKLGFGPKIMLEFNKQFDISNVDEFFVDKFLGYIKQTIDNRGIQEDMQFEFNIKGNPIISQILDEFFKD